ncbi:MAG: hypothetical protein AAF600_14315 [Bacteroidota bacterium]
MIIERPEIRGTLYDAVIKRPIEGVSIYIDYELITSNEEGKFIIEGITRKQVFNFESGHDPKFYSIKLKHPKYDSINIKKGTRGSFNQKVIVYDSIFLQPIDNTTLPSKH